MIKPEMRARAMALWVLKILRRYQIMTEKPFSEVEEEYAILLRPMPTDADGKIRYFENLARLYGDLATSHKGPPMFESKGNQRKLLILIYFTEKGRVTSLDVSSDLNMSLTNASERLRRYYKQGLLTRRALGRRRRGRPTMVYELTESGRRRLAFLIKNVKFRRTETDESKKYQSGQRMIEMMVRALRHRLTSP